MSGNNPSRSLIFLTHYFLKCIVFKIIIQIKSGVVVNMDQIDVLELAKINAEEILKDISAFKEIMAERGFQDTVSMARIDDIVAPLTEYSILLEQQDDIAPSVLRNTGDKTTEYLLRVKAQLSVDLSQSSSSLDISEAELSSSKSLASIEGSQDLFDALIAQTKPGNKTNWDNEDVFIKMDAIIKRQTDYTAQLSGIALTDSFTSVIDSHIKTLEQVTQYAEANNQMLEQTIQLFGPMGEFAASILPTLDHLRQQTETSQKLLESNEKSINVSQQDLEDVEKIQAQTSAQLLRTQTGINSTCDDLGIDRAFNNDLKAVSSDTVDPSAAANEDRFEPGGP